MVTIVTSELIFYFSCLTGLNLGEVDDTTILGKLD